ncbi:unnamed protein product [Arabis nemorensis]|uniref:Uncharacterized protein n=1 Tax=Arabis nemorensis TaxID=586526 RepID=A0A565ARR1_9BRAS|nr:unnamed protein product [Arabis nemorensis]
MDEKRKEIRRVASRFIAAVSLYILTDICKRLAGLRSTIDPHSSSSHPNPTEVNMAFSLASQFNLFAHLFSIVVIMKLPFAFLFVERMRKIRQESD